MRGTQAYRQSDCELVLPDITGRGQGWPGQRQGWLGPLPLKNILSLSWNEFSQHCAESYLGLCVD